MQDKVKKFNESIREKTSSMPSYARLLDIQSEMGELAKEYLKITNYGDDDFIPDEHFKDEFGDVLYALLSLAEEVGIDSEECLDISLNKLQKRMNTNNSIGSGR